MSAGRARLEIALPGPVGEVNRYSLHARGTVLCEAASEEGAALQLAACLATGNRALLVRRPDGLPAGIAARLAPEGTPYDAVLFEGEEAGLRALNREVAGMEGPIRPVLALAPDAVARGEVYPLDMLAAERSTSTNTAAAGGNASLMSL